MYIIYMFNFTFHHNLKDNIMTNQQLISYKKAPIWTKDNIPNRILGKHNTKVGSWGQLTVFEGQIKFYELNDDESIKAQHILTKDSEPYLIEPQSWHKVEPIGDDFKMQIEFLCTPEDFFAKKYDMTATHSAVVDAVKTVQPCKAIDLGCGQGRNALYLSLLGFDVTASDYNPNGLGQVTQLAQLENLAIVPEIYDMNTADINGNYDFMVATVVFMFLQRERVPAIIKDMQDKTNVGGYNLIVSAMDTADLPCRMPFSFTFKENELKEYYQGWEFVEYNENIGSMHTRDENGNPIQLKFVTMLAKKV